jgi:hypothetical protein
MAQRKSSHALVQPKEFWIAIEIVGTQPVIQHDFSQKSVEEMLRRHMGYAVEREPKKPRDLIEQATIRNMNGDVCVPVMAFKKGMLDASLPIKGLVKKRLMGMLWIEGGSIKLKYEQMTPRMDVVRLPNNMPDIRFRPMFSDWSCRMLIGHTETIQTEVIVDLLSRAGKLGVGEFRPGRNGTFGTYKVSRAIEERKEINEIRKENQHLQTPLVIPDWAMDVEFDDELMKKIAGSQASHASDDIVEDAEEETTTKSKPRKGKKSA